MFPLPHAVASTQDDSRSANARPDRINAPPVLATHQTIEKPKSGDKHFEDFDVHIVLKSMDDAITARKSSVIGQLGNLDSLALSDLRGVLSLATSPSNIPRVFTSHQGDAVRLGDGMNRELFLCRLSKDGARDILHGDPQMVRSIDSKAAFALLLLQAKPYTVA